LSTDAVGEAVVCFLIFLRQKLQQEGGRWVEVGVELKIFQIHSSDEPRAMDADEAARMVRAFSMATRVRDPQKIILRADLIDIERNLYSQLRQPTSDEIQSGVRYATWPLALIVAS
jgi:hypothetical protein